MVIFAIVCCHGNSLQCTHMNENGIPGVLLISTVNARSLNPKLKQILHFQFVILFQVQIVLKLQGATLSTRKRSRIYFSNITSLIKTITISSNVIAAQTPLFYRQECFTEKYTTCKIHTRLHPGLEWRIFHILTSEAIDNFTDRVVFMQLSVVKPKPK